MCTAYKLPQSSLLLHTLFLNHHDEGMMKIYILFCIIVIVYKGASIEIRPKLQRNILNFGYGINYKYEGMLAHSFDRFYVVTKFMLPTIGDLKFSKLGLYMCLHGGIFQIQIQEDIC